MTCHNCRIDMVKAGFYGKTISALRVTTMAAGVTDRTWGLEDLIETF
jgi:hypothetical protein